MSISWTTSLLNSFPISIGILQDDVLSPILFTIYIDAERFVQVGHWMFLEIPLCGALGYADDVVLLTPSPALLRISTNTTFSLTKTEFICLSCSLSSSCRAHSMFYGRLLFFVDTLTQPEHLIMIWVTLITSCVTWLRRPIAYLPPFPVMVLLFQHVFFRLTVYPSTVQHSGHFPVLHALYHIN